MTDAVTVTTSTQLQAALDRADDGAVIALADGTYVGNWLLHKSVTLSCDDGDAKLVGDGGAVVVVQADDIEVTLRGLVLSGGHAQVGGGVTVSGFSAVLLDGCTLAGNRPGEGPGSACFVSAGTLELRSCVLKDNGEGCAIAADGVATLRMANCEVSGKTKATGALVSVRAGAEAVFEGCTLFCTGGTALRVAGTTSQRPNVALRDCTVTGTPSMDLATTWPGKTTVQSCWLSGKAAGVYRPL